MRTSWSVEQSDRPEDESGQQNLAGKQARSFWMKPIAIVGADSYHQNHFGSTVEIFDPESWLENGSQLQAQTCRHYLRICSIGSGQQLTWEQLAVSRKRGPEVAISLD